MPLRPTDEQQAILDAHGRVVLINARAGTGKTATLRLIAEAHRDQKILYLAFNKQARLDAEGTFPPAVETKTVHGFAMKHEARVRNKRWEVSKQGIGPADFLPAFQGDVVTQHRLAAMSHGLLNFYMNSPYEPLEKALPLFSCQCLEEKLQTVLESQAEAIVHACRTMAKAWHAGAKECSHDFYLKLFHASKRFHKALGFVQE